MDFIAAKKSLGQNFLKDESVLSKIANSFEVTEKDLIIEIGPGKGALTKYFAKKKCDVICYELDERMIPVLKQYESDHLIIKYQDFLKTNLLEDIKKDYQHIYVIANIPYYITTPILEHIMKSPIVIDGLTLLVQKEVAVRFAAKPKTKDYGYFTVYLSHLYDVEYLFSVPARAFVPAPKVESAVVRLKRKSDIINLEIEQFQKFAKLAFQQKRKTLKNNLKNYSWDTISQVLIENGYSENVRSEELSYEMFLLLFKTLNQKN